MTAFKASRLVQILMALIFALVTMDIKAMGRHSAGQKARIFSLLYNAKTDFVMGLR